ncbi:hypothetical protein ACHAWC_009318 [Mediolabrus comicus]
MGVEKLPAMLKKCAGPKRKIDGITIRSSGKKWTIGMDVSCAVVSIVKSDAGAQENLADPPLPQQHVGQRVYDKIRQYHKLGIEVIPVFDGISRTPLKQGCVGGDRDNKHENAKQSLKKLLKTPWPSDEIQQKQILKNIAAMRRAAAKVNENTIAEVMQIFDDNDIKYVVAPFEADWQLAYMYSQGIINAIETKDSDFWALLDQPCCLLEVNSSDLKGYLCFSEGCSLIGSNDSMQECGRSLDKPIHHITRVGAIVRATVYGNDYHNGIKGVGEVTLEKLIDKYKDDENGLIQYLTRTFSEFKDKYEWIDGIYRNAPVFEMKNNTTTAGLDFSFTGNIVSHEGRDIQSWMDVVRFDPHALIYTNYGGQLSERPTYNDIAMGIWLAAYGKDRQSCFVMRETNTKGEDLPYCCNLNFDTCPPCYQPEHYLMRWLNIRGYQRRKRHNLLKVVNNMRKQKNITLMTEEEARILLPKSMRYSGLEVLLPSMESAVWERNDLRILRKVKGGNKYIRQIFGKRNGVRRRALNRLRNGHFYIDTLKTTKVKSKAKYGKPGRDLSIIQCQCLASMRSNVYIVNLVVNKDGVFIKSPYSRCSCAAGNMFCAHMLGLNLLCQVAKRHPTWDKVTLQNHLPSRIDKLQRLCIPVSGMWSTKMNTR